MNKKDLSMALSYIYNSTLIPIHHYHDNVLVSSYPALELPSEFLTVYKSLLDHTGKNIDYKITNESLYIGYIKNPRDNEELFIGPVSTVPIGDPVIDQVMLDCGISPEHKPQVKEFFTYTPVFSMIQFLNILALCNAGLNGEYIDIFETFNVVDKDIESAVGKSHLASIYERKESETFHDTYFFEQEYYGYVERGDLAGLEALIRNIPNISAGQMATDSIRQEKNIFITSMTIATRRAIAGGLDIETAYQLSDSYVQEVERMTDITAIRLLNATAIMDITRRVAESKIPMDMETDIYKAIQYISNHVNKNILVEDVAEYLGIDRSTLSRKFKRELGFNISSYIMRRKLEEAKSLLIYTDKSISEISEYLCFSTQSYFQNVFRSKFGTTPKKFRIHNRVAEARRTSPSSS